MKFWCSALERMACCRHCRMSLVSSWWSSQVAWRICWSKKKFSNVSMPENCSTASVHCHQRYVSCWSRFSTANVDTWPCYSWSSVSHWSESDPCFHVGYRPRFSSGFMMSGGYVVNVGDYSGVHSGVVFGICNTVCKRRTIDRSGCFTFSFFFQQVSVDSLLRS